MDGLDIEESSLDLCNGGVLRPSEGRAAQANQPHNSHLDSSFDLKVTACHVRIKMWLRVMAPGYLGRPYLETSSYMVDLGSSF